MESEPEKTADEAQVAQVAGAAAEEARVAQEAGASAEETGAGAEKAAASVAEEAQQVAQEPTSGEAAEAAVEGEAEAVEGEAEAVEGEAEAVEGETEAVEGDAEESARLSHLKWYAVNTYSGHENKARLSLLDRIKNAEMEPKFGEVLIPTESVVEMVKGQRRTTTRKFYPGYMFVQMDLDDLSFHLVKNTPKITGFLGGNKPVPVKNEEIAGINRQMTEGATKPKPRVSFEHGENIRVVGGPFSNFTGIVEEVRPEKQKVRVLVSIFGRATPVEVDFSQVEKSEDEG